MGRKIDSVKNKASEGGESYKESKERGNKAVSDVKEMKKLIDSLPKDIDDDIVQSAELVSEGARNDATEYMRNEVNPMLENGKNKMETSNNEAKEQIQNNDKVRQVFSQMDAVAGFGRNARTEGNRNIDTSTKNFNNEIKNNNEQTKQAEDAYNNNLSDISGTF